MGCQLMQHVQPSNVASCKGLPAFVLPMQLGQVAATCAATADSMVLLVALLMLLPG